MCMAAAAVLEAAVAVCWTGLEVSRLAMAHRLCSSKPSATRDPLSPLLLDTYSHRNMAVTAVGSTVARRQALVAMVRSRMGPMRCLLVHRTQ